MSPPLGLSPLPVVNPGSATVHQFHLTFHFTPIGAQGSNT